MPENLERRLITRYKGMTFWGSKHGQMSKMMGMERLAVRIIVGQMSVNAAAVSLGMPAPTAYAWTKEPAFDEIATRLISDIRASDIEAMSPDLGKKMMHRLIPKAVLSVERAMDELDPGSGNFMKAAESVLDRTGIGRTQHVEQDVTVHLAPEAIEMMVRAEREMGAIELKETDWGYAYERPENRAGFVPAIRRDSPPDEGQRKEVEPVHGQGGGGVHGPVGRPARADGPVDPGTEQKEAGVGGPRASEELDVDDCGLSPAHSD